MNLEGLLQRPLRKESVAAIAAIGAVLLALSCSGERDSLALTEPIRVQGGAFKEGNLPGNPPPPPESPKTAPNVTSFETADTVVRLGQSAKSLVGRASVDAVAVGIRFADLGTGYWVVPVDAPDPTANGELTWDVLSSFGIDLPPGLHPLRVVAVDANGRAGDQRELRICIPPAIPDNLNACDPNVAPPAAVISLSWDTQVDLDLVVITPDGRTVDPKHPKTAQGAAVASSDGGAEGGTSGPAAVVAIDRDSNGACAIDGVNRENLVFQQRPSGSYLVYANLFDACDHGAVHFHLALFESQPGPDGKPKLVETVTQNGVLLAPGANGGAKLGTFIAEVPFQ